jgi:hypothetical protein
MPSSVSPDQQGVAADMLHHLGAINPQTGQPVDLYWYNLKQELGSAREPFHARADREAYEMEKSNPSYETAPYDQWDQNNRLDAYVRAGVFPHLNPEWTGFITPGMQPTIQKMQRYLQGQ